MSTSRLGALVVSLSLLPACGTHGSPLTAGVPPAEDDGGQKGFFPARCEQRVGDLYEIRMPATIDPIGSRFVLTVSCEGTHRIYLKSSMSIDFASIVGVSICARYRYVEHPLPNTPCVRAPCPDVIERVLDIVDLWPAFTVPSQPECRTP